MIIAPALHGNPLRRGCLIDWTHRAPLWFLFPAGTLAQARDVRRMMPPMPGVNRHTGIQPYGAVFGMARVKQDLRSELAAAGLVERIGEELIFPTLPTAVAAYVAAYRARHGAPPEGWQSVAPDQAPPR